MRRFTERVSAESVWILFLHKTSSLHPKNSDRKSAYRYTKAETNTHINYNESFFVLYPLVVAVDITKSGSNMPCGIILYYKCREKNRVAITSPVASCIHPISATNGIIHTYLRLILYVHGHTSI